MAPRYRAWLEAALDSSDSDQEGERGSWKEALRSYLSSLFPDL